MDALLAQEWQRWSQHAASGRSGNYLGLASHYRAECPPLLLIGGSTIATDRPLVVLSLEPLVDRRHYGAQVAFASQSEANFRRWQQDFFVEFPQAHLAGPTPQPYWSTMFWLVAGWAGVQTRPTAFSWDVLGKRYLELPFIPLHASSHSRAAYSHAMAPLLQLVHARIRAIMRAWPNAVFIALGQVGCDYVLPQLGYDHAAATVLPMPAASTPNVAVWGSMLWAKPVTYQRLANGALYFARRAPFANGARPKNAGLYELGRLMAAVP